jgi:AraC-like DNA-binding protein
MGLSISTLERKCLQLTGMRPKAYLNEHRLLFAYQYISNADCSIQEASRKSGYTSSSYFSVKFMARFKMRPSDLMRSDKRSA